MLCSLVAAFAGERRSPSCASSVFDRNVVILSGNNFVVTVEYETKYRPSGHKCNTKSITEVYRECPSPQIRVIDAGAYAVTRSRLLICLSAKRNVIVLLDFGLVKLFLKKKSRVLVMLFNLSSYVFAERRKP